MNSPLSSPAPVSLTTEILQIITRKRSLSWSHFKSVFDALRARENHGIDAPKYERFQLQVVLESLGHADFRFDQAPRVSVRAATLTRLPTGGLPRAILCGARDLSTAEDLQNACKKQGAKMQSSQQNNNALAPARLSVEARSLDILQSVARELKIDWKPIPLAWECAQLAPSLGERLEAGRQTPGAHLPWRARRFDADLCQWRPVYNENYQPQHSGFMAYATPEGGVTEYFLVERAKDGELRWVPLGLSWGRYASLRLHNRRALIYDERKCLLAVPQGAPLPPALARAAALCSGYAPELHVLPLAWPQAERNETPARWNFYRDVPQPIAQIICEKLEQNPHKPDKELSRALQTILSVLQTS